MDFLKHPLTLLLLYGVACYVLTFLTRRIVETAKPQWRKQADANDEKVSYLTLGARWWNEVVLYAIAPVYGVGLALGLRGTEYFPAEFRSSWLATVMAGVCCGFTCGWFFKAFKKAFSKATGVSEEDLSKPSSKPPEVPG